MIILSTYRVDVRRFIATPTPANRPPRLSRSHTGEVDPSPGPLGVLTEINVQMISAATLVQPNFDRCSLGPQVSPTTHKGLSILMRVIRAADINPTRT